jgi:hypothetical protein
MPRTAGSAPSFPPPAKEPKKAHQRGPGRPPAPATATDDKPADDPLEPNSWGASDPAIHAQLTRELAAIRQQLALRQELADGRRQLSLNAVQQERPSSAHLSERSLPLDEPLPVDKVVVRLAKRVANFEALIVRKLVARTPPGPTGVGALRVLTKAFEYYDTEGDGTVGVGELTRVLAKLNVVSALPVSDNEKEVIGALFKKHARNSELIYSSFARALLQSTGTLVPTAEVLAQQEREDWQYSTAVHQALSRRGLVPSRAPPPVGFREAWGEASAAARAVEEGVLAQQQVGPRSEATGAEARGRLPGGHASGSKYAKGLGYHGKLGRWTPADHLKHFEKMEKERKGVVSEWRAGFTADGKAAIEAARQRTITRMHEARRTWAQIDADNHRRGNLSAGEARAAEMRRKALGD